MTYFFLVDPLDGTKEFISRNGEFTVNIALIERHARCWAWSMRRPLAACSPAPPAWAPGWKTPPASARIRCRAVPADGLTVVASRSHGDETALDAFLNGRAVASRTNAGSSLKLCLVAAGEADLSTPAWAAPWNGTSPQATPCCAPPVAGHRGGRRHRPALRQARVSTTPTSPPGL